MLGLNGSYTTLARGYRAVGINPANLAVYQNKSWNIIDFSFGISNNFFSNDFFITGSYFVLLFIGFISIYSSQNTDGFDFFTFQNESFKQLVWICICIVVFFAVSILEYRFIFDLVTSFRRIIVF